MKSITGIKEQKKGTNLTEVSLMRIEIVKVDLIFRISTSLPVWC
jgi:hypothetical protein